MAPKRGQKRKAAGPVDAPANTTANGDANQIAPPNVETWPGWVEMESEPALFNCMLEDAGIQGMRVQELWDITTQPHELPHPIHAFIFLFRYRDSDQAVEQHEPANTDHIWFAEQVPDFACASIAMLNIVNNIPGLILGPELRQFKDFTQNMSSYERGEMIDEFDFMRRIHNSFASENELLEADLALKEKIALLKRKEAAAKGLATKKAKKAAAEEALRAKIEAEAEADAHAGAEAQSVIQSKEEPTNPNNIEDSAPKPSQDAPSTTNAGQRASTRTRKPTAKTATSDPKESTPSRRSLRTRKSTDELVSDADVNVKTSARGKGKNEAKSTLKAGSKESTPSRRSLRSRKSTESSAEPESDFEQAAKSQAKAKAPSTTKSKPKTNGEIHLDSADEEDVQPRRSGRARKQARKSYANDEDEEGEKQEAEEYDEASGYHFVAYLPIGDHVWKLDGLDSRPTDLGSFAAGGNGADGGTGNWVDAALPHIMGRMDSLQGMSIEFNLMAVHHDSILEDRRDLAQNVKTLNEIHSKLDAIVEDWYELEGGETPNEVVTGLSEKYKITPADIERSSIPAEQQKAIDQNKEDLHELLMLRKKTLSRQVVIRESINASMAASASDRTLAEARKLMGKAWQPALREWLGQLGEQNLLEQLME